MRKLEVLQNIAGLEYLLDITPSWRVLRRLQYKRSLTFWRSQTMNSTTEMDKDVEKTLMDAELVLIITAGRLRILKNRNLLKRSDVIKLLEELNVQAS